MNPLVRETQSASVAVPLTSSQEDPVNILEIDTPQVTLQAPAPEQTASKGKSLLDKRRRRSVRMSHRH